MKIGDVVRVTSDNSVGVKKGDTGVVVALTEFEMPVQVLLDKKHDTLNFTEDELEVVESAEIIQTHDFVEYMCREFDRMKELFKVKNDQYGCGDPLANFRTSARMNAGTDTLATMFREAWGFASKHVAHVANAGIHGHKVDESLGDIAVYAIIMKYMYEKENKK